MRRIHALILFPIALFVAAPGAQEKTPSADGVLTELKAGNAHHAAKRYQHPHQTPARQRELATGQHPHAAILSCADSRVPPEIVFDQGLGDLFDVRVAGNIAADSELASIEYAAEHLHVPLVVVMGHQKCGAVTAATEGGAPLGHLRALLDPIMPAVATAKGLKGDLVENAVRINVENVVNQLRESEPVLKELVASRKMRIVGAVYSLDTGKMEWLPAAAAGSARSRGSETCPVAASTK